MLTTTSSLVQQVKIRATTESANTISGVGGVWWGGNTRKRECWWKYHYFG
jgi:hypothetical protein